MKKLAAVLVAVGLALLGATAAAAHPATSQKTITVTWYLPAGVDPHTAPLHAWFPQTAAPRKNVWCQHDVYWYGAWAKPIVDALDDDGLLTLKNGVPEDSRVYKSHSFSWCNPGQTPSPTPTPTETPTPSSTPTPTVTPTEEQTPSPTPSETPTTRPTPSETLTPTPVPPTTRAPRPSATPSASASVPPVTSSTTSPPPRRPALVQTDAPDELAQTGLDPVLPLMLGLAFVAVGASLLFARRIRRH